MSPTGITIEWQNGGENVKGRWEILNHTLNRHSNAGTGFSTCGRSQLVSLAVISQMDRDHIHPVMLRSTLS